MSPFADSGEPLAREPAKPSPAPERPAKSGDVALAGMDGEKARSLLASAKAEGVKVLHSICQEAFPDYARSLRNGTPPKRLFSDDQTQRLADALEATNTTAEMLGRYRIRERQLKAEAAQGLHKLRDEQPFVAFDDKKLEPLPAAAAIDYFKAQMPTIAVDAAVLLPTMQTRAFTLAVSTDQVLLEKVHGIILRALESGDGFKDSPSGIRQLLEQAGVSPKNPQYSEMVFRTNMMDSYNQGADAERQSPDVVDTFPVWQYLGIRDGRQGADHEPHFDLYYPSDATFEEVRGDRPYNCRCTSRPVDKWEWADLQSSGARVETSW